MIISVGRVKVLGFERPSLTGSDPVPVLTCYSLAIFGGQTGKQWREVVAALVPPSRLRLDVFARHPGGIEEELVYEIAPTVGCHGPGHRGHVLKHFNL